MDMPRTDRLAFIPFFFTAFLVFLTGCGGEGTGTGKEGLSKNQADVISFFKEVALGFEFGTAPEVTRKWKSDILIFVGGEEKPTLQNELNEIVEELNTLISKDSIQIRFTADSSESNYYVFFGSGEGYKQIEYNAEGVIDTNVGLFFVETTSDRYIINGTMYVDIYRPAEKNQLHLLREEFTQSLGLPRDSDKYSDSIFNSNYSVDVTEYSDYDKALIELLYHPAIKANFDEAKADSVLRTIIQEVVE